MPLDAEGRWYPALFPKQLELMAACLPGPQNMILASGPRWSSKTVSALSAVCQHAWNTDRGNICLLSITQSVGVDSGIWAHLTETFMPDWISGEFGMKWVREPYVQSVTKKPCCKVSNQFGNTSSIALESLKNEDEVEERFKGKAYSMIFVNELSKFKKRKTFDTLKQCLRMPHLKTDDHIFLADTNPDLDLGSESWIYKLWYEFRQADDVRLAQIYPDIDPNVLKPMQRALKLIEFSVDDNLSLSEEKKGQLMADFAHDPDLMAAYYWGKWVTASADAIFHKVFRPKFHVIGEIPTPVNDDPEMLVPQPNCFELYTGNDTGIVNSAGFIAEKTYRVEKVTLMNGEVIERKVPVFNFLDELVITGEVHSLEDFVLEFMKKMEWWENWIGRPGKTTWHHWSDRSVFDMRENSSGRYFQQVIYDASVQAMREGIVRISAPIILQAAYRGPGSVGQRIDLTKKLLFDERMFISATKCPRLIECMKGLKRGNSTVALIQKGSIHKHAFDGSSYLTSSECYDELNRQVVANMLARKSDKEGTLVSVRV